jgi:hypothetical protein
VYPCSSTDPHETTASWPGLSVVVYAIRPASAAQLGAVVHGTVYARGTKLYLGDKDAEDPWRYKSSGFAVGGRSNPRSSSTRSRRRSKPRSVSAPMAPRPSSRPRSRLLWSPHAGSRPPLATLLAIREPLGKLVIARSYDNLTTKTKSSCAVPVQPTLAALLHEWHAHGFAELLGSALQRDDLLMPPRGGELRDRHDS